MSSAEHAEVWLYRCNGCGLVLSTLPTTPTRALMLPACPVCAPTSSPAAPVSRTYLDIATGRFRLLPPRQF